MCMIKNKTNNLKIKKIMNKFQRLISDNSSTTLARRAGTITKAAEIAQQNIVNKLEEYKCSLEMRIANLTDFAPETTDSLRPGDKNWDAARWAKELQETKQELYDINIQLNIAKETFAEYFKEEKKDGSKSKEKESKE